jgi:hypothetical protein
MPHDHELRIHLEYDVLFVADLRALLTDLERAYNLLEAEESGRRRIPRDDRVTVSTIETGKSVTLTILGGVGLVMLGTRVIQKIAEARDAAWKSEDTKWKAKASKLEYEERARTVERLRREEIPPVAQALEIVECRMEKIEATQHIRVLQIEVDGKATELLRPGNRVIDGQRRLVAQKENLLDDEKKKRE